MSDVALRMEHVYKKFRKGEVFNSLRDLIPALTGRMFQQRGISERDRREFWALRDISFDVKRGEAFGIIGANGAGKTTMLKLLSRVMEPTLGSLHVEGRVSALIELAAGFHPDLTGRENIYLYGTILGMTRQEVDRKFEEIVDFSGIAEFIDTPVKRYSSGMAARLGFSVACHVDPEVLLVDEVLSVGDYAFQRKCVERMKQVISGGASVLFVSHHLKTVAEFCSRCLLLERGHAVRIGPADEVISAYLNQSHISHADDAPSRQVTIVSVRLRNQHGECARFESGETVWVDIELRARARHSKLSVSLYISDDRSQTVFDTSMERLGYGNFTLEAGETFSCTFELQLNMVPGVFHTSVLVYRYDTQTEYDRWAPATTFYVNANEDVRGFVHCFPKLTRREIRSALEMDVVAMPRDGNS